MRVILYCPCAKFEWNWFILKMHNALRHETKWPPGGHIRPYLKTNWCAYVHHSVLPLYQVWEKMVQACLRYLRRRTDARHSNYKSPRRLRRQRGLIRTFEITKCLPEECKQGLSQLLTIYIVCFQSCKFIKVDKLQEISKNHQWSWYME